MNTIIDLIKPLSNGALIPLHVNGINWLLADAMNKSGMEEWTALMQDSSIKGVLVNSTYHAEGYIRDLPQSLASLIDLIERPVLLIPELTKNFPSLLKSFQVVLLHHSTIDQLLQRYRKTIVIGACTKSMMVGNTTLHNYFNGLGSQSDGQITSIAVAAKGSFKMLDIKI